MFNDDFMTRLLAFRNSAKYEELLSEVGQDIISWEGDEMFEELIDELVMESSEILMPSESERGKSGDERKAMNDEGENDEMKEEEETPATVVEKFKEITKEIRDDLKDAVEMGEDLSNHQGGDESGYDEYSVDGEEDGQLEGSSSEKRDEDVDVTGSQEEEEGDADAGKESDTEESGEQPSESDSQSVSSSRRESDMSETEEEKVRRLQTQALERHLQNISKDIKGKIGK